MGFGPIVAVRKFTEAMFSYGTGGIHAERPVAMPSWVRPGGSNYYTDA